MLPTVHGLQTPKWTPCNFGLIFFILHSAVIWISQHIFFINISFLTQIVQQWSRESAAFSVDMINSNYFVFVADVFFNQMVKVSSEWSKRECM